MNQTTVIVIIGSALFGVTTFVTSRIILRFAGILSVSDVNARLRYAESKRDNRADIANGPEGGTLLSQIEVVHTAGITVIMAIVLRKVLSLEFELIVVAVVAVVIWLLVGIVPLVIVARRRARQLAVLELASILEVIGRSADEHGETWAIQCSRKVFGADLLAEEEEDLLRLRISRTDVAPVSLAMQGRVRIAPAGLDRTVSKSALRQFRLKGWFVDEKRDIDVEIGHTWSLHESTYMDIADEIAWAIAALGFSLRNVRFSQVGIDAAD